MKSFVVIKREELEMLSARLTALTNQLKGGVTYPSTIQSLEDLNADLQRSVDLEKGTQISDCLYDCSEWILEASREEHHYLSLLADEIACSIESQYTQWVK